jgi:hypothetical protein
MERRSYIAKDDEDLKDFVDECWYCPGCITEHDLPPDGTAIADI